jgi:hypothetical protein
MGTFQGLLLSIAICQPITSATGANCVYGAVLLREPGDDGGELTDTVAVVKEVAHDLKHCALCD